MDGCIFPYETRGVPPFFQFVCRRWHVWKPIPGLHCFLWSSLAPPLRGDLISYTMDSRSWLTVKRMTIMSMKAHDELIWEDSERDFIVALLSCTAWLMLGLTPELWSSCLPGQLRSLIRFACFWQWCSGYATASNGKSIQWVFCLGSGPVFFGFRCVFCCLLRCFRWRNASLAGGFAGRRFLFGCGSRFCCFNRFADSKDLLSLYSEFPAYSHVRTEPLARHRPHSREKKMLGQAGCISVAAWTQLKVAFYYFVSSGGLIVCC